MTIELFYIYILNTQCKNIMARQTHAQARPDVRSWVAQERGHENEVISKHDNCKTETADGKMWECCATATDGGQMMECLLMS